MTATSLRTAILDEALKFVPALGWTSEAVGAGAMFLKYSSSLKDIFDYPSAELVLHFYKQCNERLRLTLEDMRRERLETTANTYSVSNFLEKSVYARLRMLAPYARSWPQACAEIFTPRHAVTALKFKSDMCDDIWFYAGDRSTDINGATVEQVDKFKYLGIVFTSDGKLEVEIDGRIGVASGVLRKLARSIVTKAELSLKTKLSMFKSIFIPILIYAHESRTMTEKLRTRVQAAEMGFLRRVAGLTRLDMVRESDIQKSLCCTAFASPD
ncbi:unnamed protein product [Soboliphyme baturini]|uniref:Ubiquinone biosynthesis protein n=1 Tax=Soboliphyme baturini TaxID=241478 RepID=A0A183ICV6_9BILA|nr:unnamed protein product [Soboliphyme baturini]